MKQVLGYICWESNGTPTRLLHTLLWWLWSSLLLILVTCLGQGLGYICYTYWNATYIVMVAMVFFAFNSGNFIVQVLGYFWWDSNGTPTGMLPTLSRCLWSSLLLTLVTCFEAGFMLYLSVFSFIVIYIFCYKSL